MKWLLILRDGVISEESPRYPSEQEVGWIHITGQDLPNLKAIAENVLHCHPLAVEDMTHFGQRAKVDLKRRGWW